MSEPAQPPFLKFLEAGIELVEHNETVPGLVQLFTLMVAPPW